MNGTRTIRRFPYSEEEMADAFERLLMQHRGLPGLARMWRVFREVDCQRGRPDFVTVTRSSPTFLHGKSFGLKFAGSLVMSFLHEKGARTPAYLAEHSGLSMRTVQVALTELVNHKYVLRSGTSGYLLNPARSLRRIQVWAIELKLDRPRRAVFQAQQYRAFAQRVLVVIPPSQLETYRKYTTALRRWGIGLATFDPVTLDFEVCRKPRGSSPHSLHHQAYALFQLMEHDSKT